MASINLIRLDFRLIHGQVITKWCGQINANRIIIINDDLANDSFMRNIYEMAAPPNVSVEVYTIEKAVELWKTDEMGQGRALVLFKDVKSSLRALQAGFPIKELQLGGIGGGPGRVNVYDGISLDKQDVKDLKEMIEKGAKIILQIVPEKPKLDFEKAIQKYNF